MLDERATRTLREMERLLADDKLTASAQQGLLRAATEMAAGHTGTIEISCLEGGVRYVKTAKEWRPVKEP